MPNRTVLARCLLFAVCLFFLCSLLVDFVGCFYFYFVCLLSALSVGFLRCLFSILFCLFVYLFVCCLFFYKRHLVVLPVCFFVFVCWFCLLLVFRFILYVAIWFYLLSFVFFFACCFCFRLLGGIYCWFLFYSACCPLPLPVTVRSCLLSLVLSVGYFALSVGYCLLFLVSLSIRLPFILSVFFPCLSVRFVFRLLSTVSVCCHVLSLVLLFLFACWYRFFRCLLCCQTVFAVFLLSCSLCVFLFVCLLFCTVASCPAWRCVVSLLFRFTTPSVGFLYCLSAFYTVC